MVILLDEFQELDRLGGESLLKRLRSMLTCYLWCIIFVTNKHSDNGKLVERQGHKVTDLMPRDW